MRLNNLEFHEFLIENEILALYHANTVGTSLTYIKNNGLLSRGAVEKLNLYQTPQSSDQIDKVLNVWNDIFIDTSDLHTYFGRENHYGPILFEFNIDLIKNNEFEIWVTKDNPIYWNPDTPNEERYFQSIEELRQQWPNIQRQRKMITIRNSFEPILFNYVRKILVDDPRVTITEDNGNEIHLFNESQKKINQLIHDTHTLKGKFTTRTCSNCWCRSNYLNQRNPNDLKRLFL